MPACRHLRATSASGSSGARRQVEPKKTRRSFRWAVPVGLGAVLAFIPAPAQASKCPSDTIFNQITKVRWNCIFPITICGVRAGSNEKLDKAHDAQSASKRSDEHTTELQSPMHNSNDDCRLKKKNNKARKE